MMPENGQARSLLLSDLIEALEFVSASQDDEHHAYICRQSGRILFVSDNVEMDDAEELPENPEEGDYIIVPHRRDLDLGKRLALAFVAEELPEMRDKARDIFSRKGAYRRFKDLLEAKGALERWYAYEERAVEAAMCEWCDDVGLTWMRDTRSAATGRS
ncbi:UPF0158 family protein (plasmid) [Sphingobium sp. SJ10-10]|uniref:Uncharacterized protein n=1 Tax=Sphingomonas sp. NS2 TaxID=908605 RepID=A0A0D4ZZG9_9SPHN|nr:MULTISPECIES: UPF0158 family protein [unclassified Sphingobium]AJW29331.1 hypothetical protein plasmid201_143 [Sphingomonas sp. NS2]AMK26504.1 hypothetical protein K426_28025 [Sphingobium sp. TKS]MEC6699529.1 UPF0158 family protein [Sphingobium sp. SJ10-10]